MPPRVAILAQEDSRLPAMPDTMGSLTRIVHELSLRLAHRYDVRVYSTRREPADAPDERRDGMRHVRFVPGTDRALLASYFRWRNRLGRRFGLAERQYAGSRGYFAGYIRRIAHHLARQPVELVHLHNVTQFLRPLRRALPHGRLVLQMHCEWLVELPRDVIATRLAATDLVLGVSEHIVRQIQAAFPAIAGRCRVLHNGVDPAVFAPRERVAVERADDVAALRRRLDVRAPAILYVGRLSSEKGVHVLLEAFTRLRARHADATCIVVGPDWGPIRKVRPARSDFAHLDDDYVGRLRALAAPHGPRVVLAGSVPNHELPLYHALADVLAAPSLLEAFGIPVVEAGASGLPVVATTIGGFTDTVVPGKTGLLVPPGDADALAAALEDVLANPERARALGAAARDRVVSRFSWDGIASTLAGYYDDALGARTAGRAA